MLKIKKLFLLFISFVVLLTSSMTYLAPAANAQTTFPWYNQSFPQWYNKVYDTQTSPPQEIFGERYTAAQVQWVIYSLVAFIPNIAGQALTCIFKGGTVDSCVTQYPLISENTQRTPYKEKGVFATLFDPQRSLSGVNYAREKLASLHIIPQAEAQGFGFSALNPIQNIWRICRDIMYGFFVLIIIVFAFMIMFRVKLNPQTVVSIQSSIPKIIITLILVTFSYAIAGLMIDLMYVLIGIIALIFSQFGFITTVETGTVWGKIFELLTVGPGVDQGTGGIVGWIMGYWWPFVLAFFGSMGQLMGLETSSGAIAQGSDVVGVLGMIIGIFLSIGIFIWLVVVSVKLTVLLIKTYISILISVIFSPFLIGFGAILPTGGFGLWLKNLMSNLLVYPVTGALILMAVLFLSETYNGVRYVIEGWIEVPRDSLIEIFGTSTNPEGFWYPPITMGVQSGSWDPLPILWTFASLGILAMVPNAANMVKSLMAGKGVEGSDLLGKGGALAAGLGMASGAGRFVTDPYTNAWRAYRQEQGEVKGQNLVDKFGPYIDRSGRLPRFLENWRQNKRTDIRTIGKKLGRE